MTLKIADLKVAQSGSYYTIRGAGGDLAEWTNGYDKMMLEAGIGKPTEWLQTTGGSVNDYAGPGVASQDLFPRDLVILMFPLDGLDLGKLIFFRIKMADAWFDDVIDNMRR